MLCVGSLCLLATPGTQAQSDTSYTASLAISQLQEALSQLVTQGEFLAARPYLLEMVNRYGGEEPEQRRVLEAVFYYLALSHLQEYSGDPRQAHLTKAIEYFDRYIKDYPGGERMAMVLQFKGDAYRGLGNFEEAAKAYQQILTPPVSTTLAESIRVDVLEKLVGSYYILRDWEQGIPWFRQFLNTTRIPEKQAQAAAALVEAYISSKKFNEVRALLPYIVGESPSRYNLQLNIALLEAGDLLSQQEMYNEAALFYYMVLTLEDITAYQKNRLTQLEAQLARLEIISAESDRANEVRVEIQNTKNTIEALSKLKSYTPELQTRIARNFLLTGRDWEAFWAYDRLIALYPKHPSIEDFTYAAFTQATKLGMVEQIRTIGERYEQNPRFQKYGRDIAVRLAEYYLNQEQTERFFVHARDFISKNPEDPYTSQMLFLMGTAWTREDRFEEMLDELAGYIDRYKQSPMLDGAHYWRAMAYLFTRQYQQAADEFQTVIDEYPSSAYYEDASYRVGVSHFGMEDYATALEEFNRFVNEYPASGLRGEAEFFLGDLYSLMDDADSALHHYALVPEHTDNPSFIRNAAFQSAQIYEALERYEEMEAVIKGYIASLDASGEYSDALFILGRTYGRLDRPRDMDAAFWEAVEKFGHNRSADGVDEILLYYPEAYTELYDRVKINVDFFTRMKTDDAYRAEMIRNRRQFFQYFYENPDLDNDFRLKIAEDLEFANAVVDDATLLDPYLNKHQAKLDAFPEQNPIERLLALYHSTADDPSKTLHYRVQMALDHQDAAPPSDHVFTIAEYAVASPATLVWMGRQIADFDIENARQAYETVIEQFPESRAVQDALMALGDLDASRQQYEEALAYYEEAQAQFPGSDTVHLAILRQADMLTELARYDEAVQLYESILRNRNWRGEPQAEALYKIGWVYFLQDDYPKAHAFFERTFIGHGYFRNWAAKAYLQDGITLERMGQPEDAKKTYAEFLAIPGSELTEEYPQIRQKHDQL